MAKKAKKGVKKSKSIVVDVAAFGRETVTLRVKEGSTIGDVLEEAGADVPAHAQVYANGDLVSLEDIAEADDIISVVTPKQAGGDEEEGGEDEG